MGFCFVTAYKDTQMPYYSDCKFERRFENQDRIPDWWQSSPGFVEQMTRSARIGRANTIAKSAGGRPVFLFEYGDPEPELRGTANFSSALAAGNTNFYYRKSERKRPVIFLLGGVHGHETEGTVGVLSVVNIMETGKDLRGRDQQALRDLFAKCRLLLIPQANPDGRARHPYESLIGVTHEELRRVGQGTKKDGTLWGWPECKANHPMVGDVGVPGAYFDDDGINIGNDLWTSPMSPVTAAIQNLVSDEGPDVTLNLHGYEYPHGLLSTSSLPYKAQLEHKAFSDGAKEFCAARGFEIRSADLPDPKSSGFKGINQTSVFFHIGSTISLTFEACHGIDCKGGRPDISLDETLEVFHSIFEYSARRLLEIL